MSELFNKGQAIVKSSANLTTQFESLKQLKVAATSENSAGAGTEPCGRQMLQKQVWKYQSRYEQVECGLIKMIESVIQDSAENYNRKVF